MIKCYTATMLIIGHRGARGLAPENSLASFDKAIEYHVAYVEFDVRLTQDGELVVIHDRHTKRVAFAKQRIKNLTLKEIKALATRDGVPIPTFSEVLTHLRGKVKLNIEIKSRYSAHKVWTTLQPYLKRGDYTFEDIIFSSSRLGELKALRQLSSEIRLALLQRRFPLRFLFVPRTLKLYGVGTKHSLLTPWGIKLAKKRGLFTYAYTVNNPTRARQLASWGLDGVCTDRPDIIK